MTKTIKDYLMKEGLNKIVKKTFSPHIIECPQEEINSYTYEVLKVTPDFILEVKYKDENNNLKISLLNHLNDEEVIK